MAPGFKSPDQIAYLCNKYVLLAHARAYRIFDEEFRPKYEGALSLANALTWYEPWTEDDLEVAELARQYMTGRYTHAIYSQEGGWPPSIEKIMEEESKKKGYSKSILPAFTQDEIEYIRGTYDFFGMNHYSSRLVRQAKEGEHMNSGLVGDIPEINAITGVLPEWGIGASEWMVTYAPGMRRQLVWLKERYGDMNIVITENGFSTTGGFNDTGRISYIDLYLQQALLAIKEDGVKLTHYTAWSMMDVFEWGYTYSVRIGLYETDFQDPKRTRTPRASAKYYTNVIKSNSLNVPKPIFDDA